MLLESTAMPTLNSNASYKFCHAVNSREKLRAALDNPSITHLEVDVMGVVKGAGLGRFGFMLAIPASDPESICAVVGHPPLKSADFELDAFLDLICSSVMNTKRQIVLKVDFKDALAVSKGLALLKAKWKDEARLWLNADVLPGPGNANKPHDAWVFIQKCTSIFPRATLSLGFACAKTSPLNSGYTAEMVNAMIQLLEDTRALHDERPITFAINAIQAMQSQNEIRRLVKHHPSFSITLWGEADRVVYNWAANFMCERQYLDLQPMTYVVWIYLLTTRALGLMH